MLKEINLPRLHSVLLAAWLILGLGFSYVGAQTIDFSWSQSCYDFAFEDLSDLTGATNPQYEWDFGDGSPVSSLTDPPHTYGAEGTYTVTLTITYDEGSGSAQYTVHVYEPVADFIASKSVG